MPRETFQQCFPTHKRHTECICSAGDLPVAICQSSSGVLMHLRMLSSLDKTPRGHYIYCLQQ